MHSFISIINKNLNIHIHQITEVSTSQIYYNMTTILHFNIVLKAPLISGIHSYNILHQNFFFYNFNLYITYYVFVKVA